MEALCSSIEIFRTKCKLIFMSFTHWKELTPLLNHTKDVQYCIPRTHSGTFRIYLWFAEIRSDLFKYESIISNLIAILYREPRKIYLFPRCTMVVDIFCCKDRIGDGVIGSLGNRAFSFKIVPKALNIHNKNDLNVFWIAENANV